MAKETQAERNKRIEAALRKRGAKFTPKAEVEKGETKRAEKRERVAAAAMPGPSAGKRNGLTEAQRRAEQAAGVFGGMTGKAVEAIKERKARMKRLEDAQL